VHTEPDGAPSNAPHDTSAGALPNDEPVAGEQAIATDPAMEPSEARGEESPAVPATLPVVDVRDLPWLAVRDRVTAAATNKAIETVFPKTLVQICIVHQIRNSLNFVSYKDRKQIAAALKPIYTAPTAEEALFQLELFAEKWDSRYPVIAKSWRANWSRIEPMFQFPGEIRRAVYTTNVIESLNMSLRKITKTRAAFPTEEAAFKLIWLGLQNIEKKWTMPIRDWRLALQQFAIIFEGRLPLAGLDGN
jgi:transposase-like protein